MPKDIHTLPSDINEMTREQLLRFMIQNTTNSWAFLDSFTDSQLRGFASMILQSPLAEKPKKP